MQDGIKIITEKLSSKYHRVQCSAKVVAVYPDKVASYHFILTTHRLQTK